VQARGLRAVDPVSAVGDRSVEAADGDVGGGEIVGDEVVGQGEVVLTNFNCELLDNCDNISYYFAGYS